MDYSPLDSSGRGFLQARIWSGKLVLCNSLEGWDGYAPGPLFEGNPVGEGTTRRDTATPGHRP